MLNRLRTLTAVLGMCASSLILADSTLVFENTDAEGNKSEQTINISGRWMRSETEPKPEGKHDYSLMDSGRLMQFNVDDETQSYRVTRLGKLFWPDAPPAPRLRPMKKRGSVAGVPCILVEEMGDEGPVAEHCMVGLGKLGLTQRDLIVVSRLFMTGRKMKTWEIGLATPDEKQIAIQSKSLTDKRSRVLKSVSHKHTPNSKLKIPNEYQRIRPDIPRNPLTDPKKYKEHMEKHKADKAKATEKTGTTEKAEAAESESQSEAVEE